LHLLMENIKNIEETVFVLMVALRCLECLVDSYCSASFACRVSDCDSNSLVSSFR